MPSGVATQTVNTYLSALYSGDLARARSVVAETFTFTGPFVRAESREEFFAGAAGLAPIVQGHRLLRQWEDGDEVCSVYEVALATTEGRGSVLMSEWHTVREGQLTAGRVVFDTAAFRALVPAPQR